MSNVLILGSGGREHAIAYVLRMDSKVKKIFISPGNFCVQREYVSIDLRLSFPYEEVVGFVIKNQIDLVIIGSEKYLADGVVDILQKEKIPVFGPTKKSAQLETSKIFSKKMMKKLGIPTADFFVFSDFYKACSYIRSKNPPYVIKSDGLAAGKGVFIASSEEESIDILQRCLLKKSLGIAGSSVVIEEYLPGKELSIMAFTDGKSIQFLRASRDHKKLLDGDKGPNTGGMGAYSHVDMCGNDIYSRVEKEILQPIFNRLEKQGIEYRGMIYVGLMICSNNMLYVLEFNCRLGDPETQCVLPLLQTNLMSIFEATVEGNLQKIKVTSSEDSSCTIMLASKGYPHQVVSGYPIEGMDLVDRDIIVFYSGTNISSDGLLQTNGGRVLSLTSIRSSLQDSLSHAYENVKRVDFFGCQYRTDIAGYKLF